MNLFRRSARFDAETAAAAPTAQVWRIALGLFLIVAIYAALIAWVMLAPGFLFDLDDALAEMATGTTPAGMLLLLASFAAAWFAVAAVAVALHRRAPLAHGGRLRWRHFPVAALVVIAFGAVSGVAAATLTGVSPVRTDLEIASWAALLLIALPLLAVQTGAEELVFRGYLQQNLAARFRTPVVWAVLPSLLFGAIHWNPEGYGGNAPMVIAVIGFTSMFFAAITARTGDIAAAWGAHFGLNFTALMIVGLDGQLSGLALWTVTDDPGFVKTALIVDFVCLTAAGLVGLKLADRLLRAEDDQIETV